MKHNSISTIALMLLTIAACNKFNDSERSSKSTASAEERSIRLSVSVNSGITKTTVAAAQTEKAINTVQILVFNSDGSLSTYYSGTSPDDISLRMPAGNKEIYALANAPSLSSITNRSQLENYNFNLADNSISGGFVMSGNASCDLTQRDTTLNIGVKRLVSRISLDRVEFNLPAAYTSAQVEYAFLSNVVSVLNIAGNSAHSMINVKGLSTDNQIIDSGAHAASCPELTFASLEEQVANHDSMQGGDQGRLYCYRNLGTQHYPDDNSNYATTTLVTAITINGQLYYYPVRVPQPEPNKAYKVSLVIKNLGSDDPDVTVQQHDATVSVTALDWDDEISFNETI